MSKRISPIEIFNQLPKTNCGECGEETCFAFATKLADRKVDLELCKPLFQEKRFKDNLEKLRILLRPAVLEVRVRSATREVRIGGKVVMYRHELRYDNPTAVAIAVSDAMPEGEMLEKVKRAEGFKYRYIGMDLTLDMIAVRCVSGDPDHFGERVKMVSEATEMPLILCSYDPAAMESGLSALRGMRPLIYAANRDNWREMADLALMYDCPLVVSAPGDLNLLRSLTKTLLDYGVEDLVLDPGTYHDEGLRETLNSFTMLRRSACELEDKSLGFPLLGAPIVAWRGDEDPTVKAWKESYLACMLILRFADVLILNSIETWSLLPLVILRQNIYTDPVKPVSVESGLKVIGNPDRGSPVLYTSNFALTYYTVLEDLKDLDCYLLVIDTEGLSVQSAVAGGKLTADKVADAIRETGIEKLVDHRRIISPGLAARISGETEEASGWEVLVGPRDSSGIKDFIKKRFYGEA
jgi:acetyl-CoA decarbonylase/synthase complex subunit gamma